MGMDKEETKLKLACKVSAFHAGTKKLTSSAYCSIGKGWQISEEAFTKNVSDLAQA